MRYSPLHGTYSILIRAKIEIHITVSIILQGSRNFGSEVGDCFTEMLLSQSHHNIFREYDAKADVWSLGCIFYEMLVGTCPFKGSNEADLLHNIKTKDLSIPKEVEISKLSVDLLAKVSTSQPFASVNNLFHLALGAQSQ